MLKKPDEPYQSIFTIPEIGEILLFRRKHYMVSVSIEIVSLRKHPIVCIIETNAAPNTIRADVWDQSWLDNIRKRLYARNPKCV